MKYSYSNDGKSSVPCCPVDEELRKDWLLALEKEHESLRNASTDIAGKFKILSNPDRVEILLMLKQREHCMDEIARKLNTRKSAVSYHLIKMVIDSFFKQDLQ